MKTWRDYYVDMSITSFVAGLLLVAAQEMPRQTQEEEYNHGIACTILMHICFGG